MLKNALIRILPITTVAAAAMAFAAPLASASSTQIGSLPPPGQPLDSCAHCGDVQVQEAAGSPSYTVPPGGGIVTSWSTNNASMKSGQVRMELDSVQPNGEWKIEAMSDYEDVASGQLATFKAHVPVPGGWRLGIETIGPSPDYDTSDPNDKTAGFYHYGVGTGGIPGPVFGGGRVNIAATVESDVDHDGLADDSEDPDHGKPAPPPAPKPVPCSHTLTAKRAGLLLGSPLGDLLVGTKRADTLKGGAGDDCLRGGRGDDKLVGGPGIDRFSGGRGNDRILAADGIAEQIDCGRGKKDRVRADRKDTLRRCERVKRVH